MNAFPYLQFNLKPFPLHSLHFDLKKKKKLSSKQTRTKKVALSDFK